MKSLTPSELHKLLKVAAADSVRNHCMILLGFKHGLRVSEICGLRIADVDLRNWQIKIRRLKGSLETTQPLEDLPGQPLLSERRVLKAWLRERESYRDPSDFVFLSQKGGALNPSGFFRAFQRLAEQAGIPADRRHPHVLKHSLGYALVAANVNLAKVRIALGHKSIASTARYAVPTDEQVGRDVNAALAELF